MKYYYYEKVDCIVKTQYNNNCDNSENEYGTKPTPTHKE